MLKHLFTMTFSVCILVSATVRADVLTMPSLDWPPYSGKSLPEQGASVAVVRAAVEAMGHELNVEFYPWSRTVYLVKNDAQYAGYFPEYYYETDELLFSDPIGTGPLGFVENTNQPIEWSSLDDLASHTIGVVRGYVNTPELDARIANGTLKSSAVTNDTQNLQKVGRERLPLAVVDANVLAYLKENDPALSAVKDKLQMNKKLLVDKKLYIAFADNEEGRKWRDIVNEGLKKIDIEQIMQSHLGN
ncbi:MULTISPECIES: ABC transporter substrate-binding protein [Salinivibrio]|uniref:Amino acid ABC transporter substrate-binding protein n=1 Tax=Salinivibrio costicola TaxID=51367 RepID=A0ABX6K7W0_SALCS|nr:MULTISPECIES: transporter substrate-binding domain-containing protein [Salinivibrio]PCE65525.1 ABC transporter [Salinivibrio sp. YCSC6]QCF37443.1 amino acid ABC transporter substrate-binding protein [Salinivibrio sp. YCSC6]QIR07619.1 amino acid ABC transporter substrate-binding protein [Salinivibrio costicola]